MKLYAIRKNTNRCVDCNGPCERPWRVVKNGRVHLLFSSYERARRYVALNLTPSHAS